MTRFFALLFPVILASFRAHSGAFEPAARWDQNEIRVCWLDSVEFRKNPELLDDTLYFNESNLFHSPSLASSIQNLIQSEFTLEKTGLAFTGFQKCRIPVEGGKPDADAILALEQVDSFDEIIEGGSSIGVSVVDLFLGQIVRRNPEEDEGMPSVVLQIPSESTFHSKTQGYEESIRLTALHEFGHLAGLHHEHAAYREEALEDPYCLSSPYAADLKKGPDPAFALAPGKYLENLYELKGALRSGYDSKSIMSYCHTRQLVARGGAFSLSPGDRAILKSVYSK
ncbi:MAG: hypothetical protein KGP28_10295 [Bdellovibrionales bacterium]|nr:hypothetical protein [Bdellovibrionales bacterium]